MPYLRYEQDTLNAQFCVIGCCCCCCSTIPRSWFEQDTLIAQFCVIGCCHCSCCCCSKILHLRCEPVAVIGVMSVMAHGASKMH